MKFFRNIIAIPVVFLAVGLIYYLIGLFLSWLLPKDTFWLLVMIFILGGAIIPAIYGLSGGAMILASKIAANKMVSLVSGIIASVLFAIHKIVAIWSMDIHYSGKIIFFGILFTLFYIILTVSLIGGAARIDD